MNASSTRCFGRRSVISAVLAGCALAGKTSIGAEVKAYPKRRAMINADAFVLATDASLSEGLNRAVHKCALAGGGIVRIAAGRHRLASPVRLRSGVSIVGEGSEKTVVELAPNNPAAFWDENVGRRGITISGLTIAGVQGDLASTRTRGIWLDAQGVRRSQRVKLFDLRFTSLFRGIEIDHVDGLIYDKIVGADLADSLIYLGEHPQYRSCAIWHGSVTAYRCLLVENESGGGVVVIAYADDVACRYTSVSESGPASGATNLFHGLYFRAVRRAKFGTLRVSHHSRGAALHVYSDVDRNEPYSEDISGLVSGSDILHYSGVRLDRCRRCTLEAGWSILRAREGPVRLTNSSQVKLHR